jgi:hypothetical protein
VHHASAEADGFEDVFGAGGALGGGGTVVDERELDIVERGGAGEEVEGLEDEADFFIADAGELVVIELGDIVTVEPVAALRRGVEAADEVHQRGFTGSGWAHDGNVLVVADAEVDAAEGVDLLVSHLIGLPEIVGDDDVAGVWAGGVAGVDGGFDCGFDGHPVLHLTTSSE